MSPLHAGMSPVPGQYEFIVVVEAASTNREVTHPKRSIYEFPQSRIPVKLPVQTTTTDPGGASHPLPGNLCPSPINQGSDWFPLRTDLPVSRLFVNGTTKACPAV